MKQMAETMDHSEFDDELKLSRDEANRLKAAFQDKEFLKLFQDYVEDVTSAESKKSYEEAIISMEKDRGFDVKFLHPLPCYVMKFHCGTKYFINICKNENVKGPTYERKNEGTQWSIPTILSKPREDLDKKQAKCTVVDVMFHPDTMDLAAKNGRIKTLVEDTAISMVEEKFGISLKGQRPAYPKMKYKGIAPSVVLQNNGQSVCKPMEDYVKELMKPKATDKEGTGKDTGHLKTSDQNNADLQKNDGLLKTSDQNNGDLQKNDVLPKPSDQNNADLLKNDGLPKTGDQNNGDLQNNDGLLKTSDQNNEGPQKDDHEKNGTRKSGYSQQATLLKNARSETTSGFIRHPGTVSGDQKKALGQKTKKKERPTDQDDTIQPSLKGSSVAPKYFLKYRNIVDLQDYSLMGYTDTTAPKAIVVEIQLPEVSRAGEVQLEVTERKLVLWSGPDAKHKYDLEVELSYAVNSDSGTAKFDKVKKVLCVTLPVKERLPISNSLSDEKFANGA